MGEKLFIVMPPVVQTLNTGYEVEADFANNLNGYLRNYDQVTFACAPIVNHASSGILRSVPVDDLRFEGRLRYVPLPYAYREDRYIRHYAKTRERLLTEISAATHLLFAPHALFDWATLAAHLAIREKRRFGFESDIDQERAGRFGLEAMPWGPNKLRKTIWAHAFRRGNRKALANASVALLQGQDVMDAYGAFSPNPQKVLNVQITAADCISDELLQQKIRHIAAGDPLRVGYAGRIVEMKGPIDWIRTLHAAVQAGVKLEATWFGDGAMADEMRSEIARLGLQDVVKLAGVLPRDDIFQSLGRTDIFLFCHKFAESPRCLVEAIATGCALVGYGAAYPRDLVSSHGGGEFVGVNDWNALAALLIALDADRQRLAGLVASAAASGRGLDRDEAIQNRVNLLKTATLGSAPPK